MLWTNMNEKQWATTALFSSSPDVSLLDVDAPSLVKVELSLIFSGTKKLREY